MSKPMRFYRWDYDNDTVTQYERQGECNMCGQCCMALIRYNWAGKRTPGGAAMGTTTDEKGVWAGVTKGRICRYINMIEISKHADHICPAFRFNGCTLHAEKSMRMRGKLALCEAWPMIPDQVDAFDECSYTFKVLDRWKISTMERIAE